MFSGRDRTLRIERRLRSKGKEVPPGFQAAKFLDIPVLVLLQDQPDVPVHRDYTFCTRRRLGLPDPDGPLLEADLRPSKVKSLTLPHAHHKSDSDDSRNHGRADFVQGSQQRSLFLWAESPSDVARFVSWVNVEHGGSAGRPSAAPTLCTRSREASKVQWQVSKAGGKDGTWASDAHPRVARRIGWFESELSDYAAGRTKRTV